MDQNSNTLEPSRDIVVEKRRAAAIVTLSRPRSLNALTDEMRAEIAAAMPEFSRDPMIYGMVIRAEGDRAFCAGGDVRQLAELARRDLPAARKSFEDEYRLNWRLECFSKPTVSLIDGAVIGSGVGLTLYGTHRVAGQNYRFAMPETAIGLFPDVGVCHALARMPDEIGTYLALTGDSIGRADAFALGLVTHCIDREHYDEIVDAFSDADPVDDLLDPLHRDPGYGELAQVGPHLRHWFAGESVPAILERLANAAAGSDEASGFARSALEILGTRAPLSLAVTLRHLRNVRLLDLRETLTADYRLGCAFLDGHDFYEGVRAMLIDKDRSPRWRPATLSEIDESALAPYFTERPDFSINLPTRAEMQAARA